MMRPVRVGLTVLAVCLSARAAGVRAQGLVWSLPPDGTWVRYAGDYSQTEAGYVGPTGEPIATTWQRELTIRSVGEDTAEYLGETVPARWLEFELVTTNEVTRTVDGAEQTVRLPARGSHRVYKVLVPESAVVGDTVDPATKIPVSHLPVIRGYQKIDDGQAQPIDSGVLNVYPLLTLLRHYETLSPAAGQQAPQVPPGAAFAAAEAAPSQAEEVTESRRFRSTSRATLWRSDAVPFGLAAWEVTLTREAKEVDQPRADFQPVATLVERMSAQETGTDAMSGLPDAR